ncbi:hypothetical protein [Cohaesibacter celericrescens]|uniref:Glycosyltransferase RgtA/B/C/D-like domain-containing protein n=1 Tax=Cohaesibacter celericrescens TaxID=2067669 RepID=A0A2N5XV22_9HYPH|nr:hypothetical protein [Cohaesibacter celericrescens]PLW78361.1 hypothetical protein C0081_04505 [Cohaesibacter celericrescens]
MTKNGNEALDMRGNGFGIIDRKVTIVVSGIFVLAACHLLTTIPYGRSFHDLFVLLDGAYRISVGQMPHVDFSSPIGPLLLFVMRAGEMLFPQGNAFVVYHALMWLLLTPAVTMLAPRFSSYRAFLAALGIFAAIMLLPMTLDDTYLSEISYFASYNRFATGILLLIGLWYVLPKSRFDGFLLAFLLFLLVFIKITAAMVGLGIVVSALVLRRAEWWTGALAAVWLFGSMVVLETATGLVSGYMSDIGTMIALNEESGVYAFFYSAFNNWLVLLLAGLLVSTALWSFVKQTDIGTVGLFPSIRQFWIREAFLIDTVLLVIAAWGAESQNTGGLGLIAAAAIFFHPVAWRSDRLITALLVTAMIFPVANMAVKRSLKILIRERVAAPVQPMEILAKGTRIPLPTYEGARFFSEILHEKLELLREIQAKRYFFSHDPQSNAPAFALARYMDTVRAIENFKERNYKDLATSFTSLVFSDPFARTLGLMPAKGTMLTMDLDRTVPHFTKESAGDYLKTANGVFVDRCDIVGEDFGALFDPVLKTDFNKLPLTACWDFYIRKTSLE